MFYCSARAPTIHLSDVLDTPSSLRVFYKSLGFPIHSVSVCLEYSFLQWGFAHYFMLFDISPCLYEV